MRSRIPFAALILYAMACAPTEGPNAGVELALQALVDSVAAAPEIPGALLYAHSPSTRLDWAGAGGVSHVESGGRHDARANRPERK